MTTQRDCEHVRMNLMAVLDGEHGAESAALQEHVASCASCREWLDGQETLATKLRGIGYPREDVDLWPAVQQGIRQSSQTFQAQRLWPFAAMLVVWRALQLFIDLPLPLLQLIVPLLASGVVLWRAGDDFLRIQTLAPELQKRGL